MAESVTLARGIYHQTLDPIEIKVDPNLKGEIAMRNFWIMRVHLPKKSRADTRLGKVSKCRATRLKHFTLPQADEIHESKMLNEVGDIRDLANSLEKMVIELHETGK